MIEQNASGTVPVNLFTCRFVSFDESATDQVFGISVVHERPPQRIVSWGHFKVDLEADATSQVDHGFSSVASVKFLVAASAFSECFLDQADPHLLLIPRPSISWLAINTWNLGVNKDVLPLPSLEELKDNKAILEPIKVNQPVQHVWL